MLCPSDKINETCQKTELERLQLDWASTEAGTQIQDLFGCPDQDQTLTLIDNAASQSGP